MLARTRGSPGAVTAMFTYRPPPQPQQLALVQEADLEIRTQDPPNFVQYTNQPAWNSTSDIKEATRNASMPSGKKWSDWAFYRMDWTPGQSTWFVNGVEASRINFQAPRDPSQVMFNVWSDGGSWSGIMGQGGKAEMQVQWIEMVYNSTEASGPVTGPWGDKKGCANICSIDETTQLGTPVLISNPNGEFSPRLTQLPTQPYPLALPFHPVIIPIALPLSILSLITQLTLLSLCPVLLIRYFLIYFYFNPFRIFSLCPLSCPRCPLLCRSGSCSTLDVNR